MGRPASAVVKEIARGHAVSSRNCRRFRSLLRTTGSLRTTQWFGSIVPTMRRGNTEDRLDRKRLSAIWMDWESGGIEAIRSLVHAVGDTRFPGDTASGVPPRDGINVAALQALRDGGDAARLPMGGHPRTRGGDGRSRGRNLGGCGPLARSRNRVRTGRPVSLSAVHFELNRHRLMDRPKKTLSCC